MAGPEVQLGTIFFTWAGTDRASQFNNIMPESVRAKVDSGTFGSVVEKKLLGLFSLSMTGALRPDADGAFVAELTGQHFNATEVTTVFRSTTASKAVSNPEITCKVLVAKAPPFSAERGALIAGDLDLQVNYLKYDDGTNVYEIL